MTFHKTRSRRARGAVNGAQTSPRITISLPADDMALLAERAQELGVPTADVIRRAVKAYLDQVYPQRWKGKSGIYAFECLATGQRYIGSAVDLFRRWREHFYLLRAGTHYNVRMQKAWSDTNGTFFLFRPLLFCSRKDLLDFEQRALKAFRPELNILHTVRPTRIGHKPSAETIAKMRKAKQMAAPPRAKTPRPPMSAEARRKISEFQKGKTLSAEHKKRIGEANRGKKRSPEQCARISAANRNGEWEIRCKLSDALRGRSLSEERRAQMREGQRKRRERLALEGLPK